MNKWAEIRFRDLCSDISYGYTESATYTEVGPKFLRITDITSDYINWETVPFCKISEQDFEKYKLQYNDIVIARTGATSGYNQQFRENIDAVYASYLIRFRIDESKANPRFVYYYLQSSAYKGFVNNYISGAAQPGINATVLSKLKIPLPDEKTQKHIAIVLSAYDDLIKANTRRIELLEQTAQELYKEWFVRFRFPGHENAKLEDGLPKGWIIKRLSDYGRVETGKTPSTEIAENYGGEMMFVKTPDMHGNMFIIQTEDKLSERGHNTQPKKLLPSNSIMVSCIGTAGVVSINAEPAHTNQQINSIVLNNPNELEWLYHTCKSLKETIELFGATGATMTNLSKGKFEKLKVVDPGEDLILAYHNKVKPLFDEIKSLMYKNQNLAAQRDMLLPRLMSGKLEV